jgi:hypothetical protein
MSLVSAPKTPPAAPSLLGRPFQWLHRARDRRRARLLEEAYRDARLTLGRRMFAAGIDDGETGAQIAALIGESPEVWAQRNRLLIRLADASLEDDAPLPGADAEFQHALALKLKLVG